MCTALDYIVYDIKNIALDIVGLHCIRLHYIVCYRADTGCKSGSAACQAVQAVWSISNSFCLQIDPRVRPYNTSTFRNTMNNTNTFRNVITNTVKNKNTNENTITSQAVTNTFGNTGQIVQYKYIWKFISKYKYKNVYKYICKCSCLVKSNYVVSKNTKKIKIQINSKYNNKY